MSGRWITASNFISSEDSTQLKLKIKTIKMSNEKKKLFTRDEVMNHNDRNSNWFILHDKVYDVYEFLNEHPGGEEVLLEQRKKDASEPWDDVGHSEDAKELMQKYLIGEIVESERRKIQPKNVEWVSKTPKPREQESGLPYGPIAIALLILIIAYSLGLFSS